VEVSENKFQATNGDNATPSLSRATTNISKDVFCISADTPVAVI